MHTNTAAQQAILAKREDVFRNAEHYEAAERLRRKYTSATTKYELPSLRVLDADPDPAPWRRGEPSPNGASGATLPTITSTRLSDVESEQTDWLWEGRIPYGMLAVVEGDPDTGKSTLSMALGAAVSSGGALPDGTRCEAADVLLVNYEDSQTVTIRPRAEAAGANLARIHTLDGVGEWLDPVRLPDHITLLRAKIEETGARLVIIDPLMAALSADVNSYRDQDVRRVLAQLKALAEELGVAIVVIRHLAKTGHPNAIRAGGGSIGITGAARVVLAFAVSPENPEERVLAVVKCNVARKAPSLRFTFESCDLGHGINVARLVCVGTSEVTADDLNAARSDQGDERGATEEARNWVEGDLKNGRRLVREVMRDGRAAGFTDRTLQRAAQHLKVVRHRETPTSPFTWELPAVTREASSPSESVLASLANIEKLGENAVFGENASLSLGEGTVI